MIIKQVVQPICNHICGIQGLLLTPEAIVACIFLKNFNAADTSSMSEPEIPNLRVTGSNPVGVANTFNGLRWPCDLPPLIVQPICNH